MKTKEIRPVLQPEEITPPLPARQSGSEPFRVPAGYFDELPGRVQDRILTERNGKRPVTWLTRLLRTRKIWIPVLAAACILIALFISLPVNKSTRPMAVTSDSLNLKAAYDASYAGENISADYAEIDKVLSDSWFDAKTNISFIRTNDTELSNDSIIDYLQDQEMDPELLAQL